MPDEKTPPTGSNFLRLPPRPESPPTIASVYNLVAGLAGQMGGLRTDVELIDEKLDRALTAQLPAQLPAPPPAAPFEVTPPATSSTPPVSAPTRPSIAARAATTARNTPRWLGIAVTALTISGQVLATASSRPEYGPIVQALRIVANGLSGLAAAPPSDLPPPEWRPLDEPRPERP